MRCKVVMGLDSSAHPSILFHLLICTSLEMAVFCILLCEARLPSLLPKLVVSSSELMVILAHFPVITCDQHPWLLRGR